MNSLIPLVLLVVSTVAGLCSPVRKREVQDDEVAALLQEMVAELLGNEGDYIEVDDLSDTFGGRLLDGKLEATGGSVGNLSTLRFVTVSVTSTAESLTLSVQVKLDHLEISYERFTASVRFLSVSGSFKATVATNCLMAQVTLTLDPSLPCLATLDVLELSQFDGFDLAVSGVGSVDDKFVSRMANMVVNKFSPEIKPMAEEKLRELILPYVSLACEYWQ